MPVDLATWPCHGHADGESGSLRIVQMDRAEDLSFFLARSSQTPKPPPQLTPNRRRPKLCPRGLRAAAEARGEELQMKGS